MDMVLLWLYSIQAWQVQMMLFSMCLSTSDTVYEAQGLLVCFCHGIYISSLTQGLKTTSCASTENSAGTEGLDRLAGMFATLNLQGVVKMIKWSKKLSFNRSAQFYALELVSTHHAGVSWQILGLFFCSWLWHLFSLDGINKETSSPLNQ